MRSKNRMFAWSTENPYLSFLFWLTNKISQLQIIQLGGLVSANSQVAAQNFSKYMWNLEKNCQYVLLIFGMVGICTTSTGCPLSWKNNSISLFQLFYDKWTSKSFESGSKYYTILSNNKIILQNSLTFIIIFQNSLTFSWLPGFPEKWPPWT